MSQFLWFFTLNKRLRELIISSTFKDMVECRCIFQSGGVVMVVFALSSVCIISVCHVLFLHGGVDLRKLLILVA